MANEPVNVGLIGCGGIAGAHRNGYEQLADDVRVTWVCDPNAENAARRAGELGAQALSDYHDILARPDIDAVDLCLPHDLHASIAIEAIQAGKHVLVEKPVARNLEEADAMIRAAREAGVVLMVGHNQRYAAGRTTAHRLVKEGAIGDVYMMRTDHQQWVNMPPDAWRNDPEKLGGGAVADSGIHSLDQLVWVCGPATSVYAALNYNHLTPRRGEDAGLVTLQHENGAISELAISWTAQRFPWGEAFFIYGTKGVIHNVGGLHLFNGTPREGEFQEVPLDHDDNGGFREEIRDFVHCIRTGDRPLSDGASGRATLEVLRAVYESAETGRSVPLESASKQ
jgi:predicted dehydrogenase